MIGVGALPPGDGAGGKVAGIGTAVGGEAALESSPRPAVNCHGVPRIDCTASALYCSPTGRRLIVRINFTPVAVPMMFSSVASERPSHTPLLQGLRALFARDAGELSRNSTYSPNSTNGRVYSTPWTRKYADLFSALG